MNFARTALCVAIVALGLSPAAAATRDCGDADAPCRTENGFYNIALPTTAVGPVPAILYIHGYGGSGAGVLRRKSFVQHILDRGYAVILPTGVPRQAGAPNAWNFGIDRPGQLRDDVAFINEVMADATERFEIDRERVIASGFSIGGSMTWWLACNEPDAFAAFAPISGAFWRPFPQDCAGPVRLFHTHGWRDMTVPLEGRLLRGGALRQGDVWEAMQMWRLKNGCANLRATEFAVVDGFWRRRWTKCESDRPLEFALFDGGHVVPKGWSDMVLDWFENPPAASAE